MLKRHGELSMKSALLSFVIFAATHIGHGGELSSNQVGTLTQLEGEVKIFSHPGTMIQGPPPHALFQGEYYSVGDAKLGDRVEEGNIVRTAVGAKAKVVFDNGDQFFVGSGTAYKVQWMHDTNPKVSLMHGKLRGVIIKGGPRGKLTIRTRAATMGVRGTDFLIGDAEDGEGTQVTILRGEVFLKPHGDKANPASIQAGFSGEAPMTHPKDTKKIEIEVRKVTKEDLIMAHQCAKISPEIKKTKVSEAVIEKIKTLESKCIETTLDDIKKADPELYAELKSKPIQSIDEINTQSVQKFYKDAPLSNKKRKPFESELKGLDPATYEKYFKTVN